MDLKELIQSLNDINEYELDHLKRLTDKAENIFLIGNGGSNAIASHMAVDYTKFLDKRCFVPNASDVMTMIVNDYGIEQMYSKFISYNHRIGEESLAILVSSSGNSKNIVEAAMTCHELNIPVITLTGFWRANTLHSMQLPNIKQKFFVDSRSYGVVEMAHHSILHSIV
jgi:D-sedoheptulose 7-phosphate isomerase